MIASLVPVLAAGAIPILSGVVMALFIVTAVLLTIVVLLQEGKGGGIAGAFGGAGGETFGVKAGSVSRFTSYLGFVFLGLALLHAGLESKSIAPSDVNARTQTPGAVNEAGQEPGKTPPGPEAPKDTNGGTPPAPPEPAPAPPAPAPAPPEPAPAPAPMDR
jgi:preprotein translocase subunit SecG